MHLAGNMASAASTTPPFPQPHLRRQVVPAHGQVGADQQCQGQAGGAARAVGAGHAARRGGCKWGAEDDQFESGLGGGTTGGLAGGPQGAWQGTAWSRELSSEAEQVRKQAGCK